MTPSTYNIPDHVAGDTWDGISSITITISGLPPTYPVTGATMKFKHSLCEPTELELSTENSGIIITNATGWILSIPAVDITLEPKQYIYSLRTTDSNGESKTYLQGSWTITQMPTS